MNAASFTYVSPAVLLDGIAPTAPPEPAPEDPKKAKKKKKKSKSNGAKPSGPATDAHRAAATARLDLVCLELRGFVNDDRSYKSGGNNLASKFSYEIGGYVGAGCLAFDVARAALVAGVETWGDDDAKHIATIDGQLQAGMGAPLLPYADDRPEIKLGTDLHRVVDDASEALAADPDVYFQGHSLVRVLKVEKTDKMRGFVAGAPIIADVPEATLRERLTKVAKWVKYNEKEDEWLPTMPPNQAISALHARGVWPHLRPLVGVVETPTMRRDGSLLVTPGYDHATGLILAPNIEIEPIPDAPTKQDSWNALAELLDVTCDFPFVSGAAACVPAAAILTLLARDAVDATPCFVFDAPTRSSGKSMVADVVAITTTGRDAPRADYSPKREGEIEKVLDSHALAGSRLLLFDNVSPHVVFGNASLDAKVTAERVSVRILGASEVRELPWRTVVFATGNAIQIADDTIRRCMLSRIQPAEERPEKRTDFKHDPLLDYVRANRARLVRAGLVVLRAFVAAGRPNADQFVLGSFESWARLVPAAICYAGGCNVLTAGAGDLGYESEDVSAAKKVISLIARDFPNGATTAELVGPTKYDLAEALTELSPIPMGDFKQSPKRLGRALRRLVGRNIGGLRLRPGEGEGGGPCRDPIRNVALWLVDRVGPGRAA